MPMDVPTVCLKIRMALRDRMAEPVPLKGAVWQLYLLPHQGPFGIVNPVIVHQDNPLHVFHRLHAGPETLQTLVESLPLLPLETGSLLGPPIVHAGGHAVWVPIRDLAMDIYKAEFCGGRRTPPDTDPSQPAPVVVDRCYVLLRSPQEPGHAWERVREEWVLGDSGGG